MKNKLITHLLAFIFKFSSSYFYTSHRYHPDSQRLRLQSCASIMYQLVSWMRLNSGTSKSIKNAAIRRFILLALPLILLCPAPASAETACEPGAFLDAGTSQCYTCPAGYNHNPLLPADVAGVCSAIGSKTTATRQGDSSFLCPAGQFPNFATGKCHSCPSGYQDDGFGGCFQRSDITASYNSPFRTCTGGSFDGLNGSCYTCPSGYSRIGLTNSCTRTVKSNSTMSVCGSRTYHCSVADPFDPSKCVVGFDYYTYTGCGALVTSAVRSGNNYYSCASGYSHDIAVPFNNNGICFKYTTTDVNAIWNNAIGCATGTFDGLNGSCYTCPSGYNHDGLLPVGTPGVCWKESSVSQIQHGNISFLCPADQFLDLATNDCYTCPTGYTQDTALSANTVGVCYQLFNTTADYVPPKNAGQACVGLLQGNCATSLICDGGSGLCRNDPPVLGQACGLSVSCADPYTCYAGTCKIRGASQEACDTLLANSCQDGLVCDVLGECRSEPPELGERCGLGVACSATPADAPVDPAVPATWDNPDGSLACLSGRCGLRAGPTQACDSISPTNTCADDLLCVTGECQHERPLLGERCDTVASPCASEHPHEIDPDTRLPLALDLVCHSGHILEEYRCSEPKKIGDICSGLGKGSCDNGLLCSLSYDSGGLVETNLITFDAANLKLRCTPEMQLVETVAETICRSWYDPSMAQSVNEQPVLGLARLSRSIGMAGSASIGGSVSVESGVVYGPSNVANPDGEYGCYVTTCGGVEPSAGLDLSACMAWDASFPKDFEQSVAIYSKVDLVGLGSLNPLPVNGGMTVSAVFENDELTGTAGCIFGGVGKGLKIAPGSQFCTTRLLKLDMTGTAVNDTDNDAVVDTVDNCTLVPNTAQRDTDSDGFGNSCDPDFDGNLVVNAGDLGNLKSKFFTSDPDADLNGDGSVNAADLAILKSFFFKAPGPSGFNP